MIVYTPLRNQSSPSEKHRTHSEGKLWWVRGRTEPGSVVLWHPGRKIIGLILWCQQPARDMGAIEHRRKVKVCTCVCVCAQACKCLFVYGQDVKMSRLCIAGRVDYWLVSWIAAVSTSDVLRTTIALTYCRLKVRSARWLLARQVHSVLVYNFCCCWLSVVLVFPKTSFSY